MTSWNEHVMAWSHPPVDNVGYLSSRDMLKWSDERLRATIDQMRLTRYEGERNFENRWRDVMGLDELTDRDVLDFGCGVGVEALELARVGNRISIADLSRDNLDLAIRVLSLYPNAAERSTATYLVTDEFPFVDAPVGSFDIFYCNGVLHHIRWPRSIIERAYDLLRPGGEVRLMVYSDVGWQIATATEPPNLDPESITHHHAFQRFVRFFDSVGDYADWYNEERLVTRFGDLFDVVRCVYLMPDDRYLGAVLRRS